MHLNFLGASAAVLTAYPDVPKVKKLRKLTSCYGEKERLIVSVYAVTMSGTLMPRPWQALERELGEYLGELRDAGRSEDSTIRPYEWTLRRLFQALIDYHRNWNPRKFTKADIEFLRDEYLTGANRYKENQIGVFFRFPRSGGDGDSPKMHILFGDTSPTRVRWLEDEQARAVRAAAIGIEKMVIHCELDLGMRRIELLRLKVSSF